MIRAQNPNIRILELAVDRLGELANEMVFLGGCATGLLFSGELAQCNLLIKQMKEQILQEDREVRGVIPGMKSY